MADFNNRFASTKQDWETPLSLFSRLHDRFHFTIDLAASVHNTKCTRFFSSADNALAQDWSGHVGWLNPPYGDKRGNKLSDWVKKAHTEMWNAYSLKRKCTTVMLIPARTNTRWFHEFCMNAQELMLVCGRPVFGGMDHGLPLPLVLVVFDSEEPVVGSPKLSSFSV